MNECTFGVTPQTKDRNENRTVLLQENSYDCLSIKNEIERRRQLNGIRGSGHDSHEKKKSYFHARIGAFLRRIKHQV